MTQLIPEGKQHFDDANGRPLVGGQVFNYLVGTTTFKNTYQDVALSILNTNPVVLDARGECAMYGAGSYRQILKDATGVTIWDQVVPDSGATTVQVVAIPVITGPSSSSPGSTITLTATSSSLLGAGSITSFTWTLPGGTTSVTPATGSTATKAITPTGSVGSTYTVSVFATDNAGNVSLPVSYPISIVTHANPTTPTTLTIASVVYQNTSSNTIVTGGSTATDGATITYSLSQSGSVAVTFSKATGIAAGEAVTFSVPALTSDTTITISSTAVDSMGGVSAPKTQSVTLQVAPTVPGTAYGGGFYVGRMLVASQNYALVVAPKATGEFSRTGGGAAAVAGSTSGWDGLSNSNAMVIAQGNNPSLYAAAVCRSLAIGGFTDWALPAKDELELLYRTFKPGTTANNTSSGQNPNSNPTGSFYSTSNPAQTSTAAYITGGSEAFSLVLYWSSTQGSPISGQASQWSQSFDNGFQDGTQTGVTTGFVRAVRLVAI